MVTEEYLRDLFEKCLATWGEEKQLRMVQEECSEVILAVSHYLRNRPDSKDKLKEELADGWLMISQMIYYYGQDEIMEIVKYKGDRTLKKIERYTNKEK
jgi:NTP pyrophosphatase (non-canonical NTP hydrolase)